MSTTPAPTDLEDIPEDECLAILRKHDFGRIAVVAEGQPLVFPINYAMSGRIIAFKTAPGTKLSYAPGTKVAVEIDDYSAENGAGWSVIVQGIAYDATESLDDVSWTARGAMPHPAAPGQRVHRVAVDPKKITGRRFGPS